MDPHAFGDDKYFLDFREKNFRSGVWEGVRETGPPGRLPPLLRVARLKISARDADEEPQPTAGVGHREAARAQGGRHRPAPEDTPMGKVWEEPHLPPRELNG